METIKDLINKIKWDKSLKPEEYTLEILDRLTNELKEIKYSDIIKLEGDFMIIKGDEEEVEIPLHRVRKVRRNKKLVWERKTI